MSVSRIAKERREREPETAPRPRIDKRESITVDKLDYINGLQALMDARNRSRELWEVMKKFEEVCRVCSGCADGSGIVAGMREELQQIGHILSRGTKGKAYRDSPHRKP